MPAEVTSFVDRRGEVAQIRQMLTASRLVTLTGVGGSGKSRLALRVAAGLVRAFADGVFQADLTTVRNPELLGYAIAEALGIDDQTDRPVTDVLVGFVRDRQLLLVLDNCEHMLDACAELTNLLLRAAADLRVIATSREALRLLGEQVWPVPPLPVPDPDRALPPERVAARYPALALFVDRACAVQQHFALTAANAAMVARICRGLDGLPLAIELAAAQLRWQTLEQLAAGLSGRMPLLQTRHASPEYHRTLQAAFDWSYRLCTPAEQTLWAALSVFAETFDLPAAEAVCVEVLPAGEILAALIGLVEKSVLSREYGIEPSRYRLLETVREYGLVRLREHPGAEEALRRRHRDTYLQLAEQSQTGWCGGPQQERVYRVLRREHANLRAALEFCLRTPGQARHGTHLAGTLWFYWTGCGFLREGRYWLDRFLAADPDPTPQRRKALWAIGAVAVAEGDIETANRILADSWQQASAAGDERIVGLTGFSQGTIALFADDYSRARQLCERALARFDALGEETPSTLMSRSILAMTVAVQGDLDTAESMCHRTLAVCAQRQDRWSAGWVYYVLTLVALARGQADSAARHARDGLRRMQVFHNLTGIAMQLELYAMALVAIGQAERAALTHGVVSQLWKVIGRRLFGSATLQAQHDQCEAAARHFLGDNRYDAAHHRGSQLDVDEAIEDVATEPSTPAGPPGAPPSAGTPDLTSREWEVARLVAQGLSNRQIGGHLVISQRTAETHVGNILRKLGFTSRTQVAAWIAGRYRSS